MAIRLRTVNGVRVALCAVETDAQPGDVYLDDADHYALAAKFAQDWRHMSEGRLPVYESEWAAMATQKLRDAKDELERWLAEQTPQGAGAVTPEPQGLREVAGC